MKKINSRIFLLVTLVSFLMMTIIASSTFTSTAPSPANGATGVTLHPSKPVSATITTSTGHLMNVTFWSNDTGVWHKSNTLVGVGNNTANWNLNISHYSTKYYWSLNLSNTSTSEYSNTTYTFTTKAQPLSLTSPSPANGATGVSVATVRPISVTVHTSDGSKMNVFLWSTDTGTYHKDTTRIGVGNATINWNLTTPAYGHTYTWGINYSNATNHNYHNQTYTFTTETMSLSMSETNYLTHSILPIVIAVAIVVAISMIAFTSGATKESLISIMILTILAVVLIQIIMGI